MPSGYVSYLRACTAWVSTSTLRVVNKVDRPYLICGSDIGGGKVDEACSASSKNGSRAGAILIGGVAAVSYDFVCL